MEEFSEDSGFNSTSFSAIYESTPKNCHQEDNLRKRKFEESFAEISNNFPQENGAKIHEDLKKLKNGLENCHLKPKTHYDTNSDIKPSVHCTPVKIFQEFPQEHSPGKKEFNELLYRGIRTNLSRKFPQFKSSPVKKCLFDSSEKLRQSRLFVRIIENPIIVSGIFKYLSDGDLYRLSMVSGLFQRSIMNCPEARIRFLQFMEIHRDNKENYRVTPPRSPENQNESPPGSPSRFNEYFKVAKRLNQNQSLTKCPSCGKPSVVENSVSQCQDLMRCGYICCLKCFSFSKDGPDFFYDKCQSSALSTKPSGTRFLSDMSNRQNESSLYSIFHSPKKNFEDSSGFYSESEMSPKPLHVKRDLRKSLKNITTSSQNSTTSSTTTNRVFQQFNESVPDKRTWKHSSNLSMKKSTVLPVIPLKNPDISTKISENSTIFQKLSTTTTLIPESPPRIRTIPVCSRQSKRNLKRLTR